LSDPLGKHRIDGAEPTRSSRTRLAGFWPAHVFHDPTRSWLYDARDNSLGLRRVVHLDWLRLEVINPLTSP